MEAIMQTEIGDIVMFLDMKRAPITASYFAGLIESGGLDGTSFFRIVGPDNASLRVTTPIEVVQGGLWNETPHSDLSVFHETTAMSGLAHKKWALSTARNAPGETYGSFFICMRDEPELDYGGKRHPDRQGFAVFGNIISGFDVVKEIFDRREAVEFQKNPVKILQSVLT